MGQERPYTAVASPTFDESVISPTMDCETAEFPEHRPAIALTTSIMGKLVERPKRMVVSATPVTPHSSTGRLPILSGRRCVRICTRGARQYHSPDNFDKLYIATSWKTAKVLSCHFCSAKVERKL